MPVKTLAAAASVFLATISNTQPPQESSILDSLVPQQVVQQPCPSECQINDALLNLVSHLEGYRAFRYKDSAGLYTIGIGHLIKPGESFREPLLPAEATNLLKHDLAIAAKTVNTEAKRPLKQNQFNALVSFSYNVGSGKLKKSTLLRKVNAKQDPQVPAQFMKWVYAGDEEVEGLVLRRQVEARLYASAK